MDMDIGLADECLRGDVPVLHGVPRSPRCPYRRGEEREWKPSGLYDLDGIAAILVAPIKLSQRRLEEKYSRPERQRAR